MRRAAFALGLTALLASPQARATGFTDLGDDLRARSEVSVSLSGYLRVRGEAFYNLDLDRGPTPSGQLLFPVPLADPKGQWLGSADLRLRGDVALYAPFMGMAVKARIDLPDNLTLGGAPDGIPAASSTQLVRGTALKIRRVWGEALTPIGLFAVGRMGNHWGLGMLANGGDCADCDSGDSADRIALVMPILGHIVAASFDISATGPYIPRRDEARIVDIDPSSGVRTVTAAILRYRDDAARERRRRAGKTTFEYGAYASHRWQNNDVPATYLPLATKVSLDQNQVMTRGYTATAVDLWLRLTTPRIRLELEAAALLAKVDQPSLLPGVLLRQPALSRQFGVAFESDFGSPEDPFSAGVDAGFASGDPAPGFGVKTGLNAKAPKPGDLDGPQASPPYDNRVDNFRFHPDYRVDRILFREIIGTVTDAVYARPHMRVRIARVGPSALVASLAAIASFAVERASTPGNKNPLGIEIDPTLSYGNKDGFSISLEHAALFPLAGLANVPLNLGGKPAQLFRIRAMYAF